MDIVLRATRDRTDCLREDTRLSDLGGCAHGVPIDHAQRLVDKRSEGNLYLSY